ncbi:uncharacterized protein EKO05_0005059 [Ascochyta rabiei]|uniref:Uncharacterized protein n=1 Tax=Didymella rabiei TaxID=5454 RepID=A0A163BUF0_DIDRA|nr:uncharacterized protein EKO05_0005059 [Ascochyta rabiei]KZM22000.1 hypothetical protein ST47_g6877 [Ascochyta rabiei]UPX14581.1 hypothetical protein EKO05_0005059 [Ascochyta rabiei]
MSTAHTCFRSALTLAFRPSNRGAAAPHSVCAFLVPALSRSSKRSFSSGKRRSKTRSTEFHASTERPHDPFVYVYPPKGAKSPIQGRIPIPAPDARGDIDQWLLAIEPYLPIDLRRTYSDAPDVSTTVTSLDLSIVINKAQDASHDILSHLGLAEARWQAAVWIAKKLVEGGKQSDGPPVRLDPFENVVWPATGTQSLRDSTNKPLRIERARPRRKLELTLDELTAAPDTLNLRHIITRRALGQLWRSLGTMILAAPEQNKSGQDTTMSHVLEIIAYLHHIGFMPDSVYTFRPHSSKYALQQPPTLHMLSSKILTALSDASWKSHEAAAKAAKDGAKVSYFLGHEIPGSRYKVEITEIAPELWLELILWSCLHGGWIADGTAILEKLASRQGDNTWGLISWREILEAEQQRLPLSPGGWNLFPMRGDAAAGAEDRARTRRTISSEIVTAFIDGLVNDMRLGVGARGTDPEVLIDHIKTLKRFLESNNLSLGSVAWDSIITRLLESGGFVPEKRPELLLRVFNLAAEFGTEVGSVNASLAADDEVPYFFEPTTASLNLLHRAMRAFINIGDTAGTMRSFKMLQRHADNNKQKSLHQFFESLKTISLRQVEPFTSQIAPIDFPSFDTKLPIPLLAKLLDLATDSEMYELGRWFVYSDDLDGPLIGRSLYSHRNIAASLVRFGTLAGENDIVLDIVKRAGYLDPKTQQQRMPNELLTALFRSQVRLRRWEAVRSMQKHALKVSTWKPRPSVLTTFVAELLRASGGSEEQAIGAQKAFSMMLFNWERLILNNIRNDLYCTLAILSTVDKPWKAYCSQFLNLSLRQSVNLSTDNFNQILGGVLDRYDSTKGKDLVEQWCYKPPRLFEPFRAPGGVPTMPQFRVGRGEEAEAFPDDIEIVQDSDAKLVLQGRILPNRQTIWAILRKVQSEVEQWGQDGKEMSRIAHDQARDTLRWAARLLYYLGYDYEDIVRDLGSLAKLAELEAPTARSSIGQIEGAEHGL